MGLLKAYVLSCPPGPELLALLDDFCGRVAELPAEAGLSGQGESGREGGEVKTGKEGKGEGTDNPEHGTREGAGEPARGSGCACLVWRAECMVARGRPHRRGCVVVARPWVQSRPPPPLLGPPPPLPQVARRCSTCALACDRSGAATGWAWGWGRGCWAPAGEPVERVEHVCARV